MLYIIGKYHPLSLVMVFSSIIIEDNCYQVSTPALKLTMINFNMTSIQMLLPQLEMPALKIQILLSPLLVHFKYMTQHKMNRTWGKNGLPYLSRQLSVGFWYSILYLLRRQATFDFQFEFVVSLVNNYGYMCEW